MCLVHKRFALQFITLAVLLCGMLTASTASDAPATEETPFLILSDAPAAPPESAEARIALRQHRESTALNRFTFPGNVLEGTGDAVDHWIVMFCPGWHDKCQGLLPSYELLGVQWENKLNKALMSSSVRFAKVDCATEKALCVSLDIDDYPSVVHYHHKERVNSWHGGAPGLVRFVKQELEGQKRRPKQSHHSKAKVAPVCAEAGIIIPDRTGAYVDSHWSVVRAVCFALLLLVAGRSTWKLVRVSRSGHTCGRQPSPSKPAINLRSSSISQGAKRPPCLPQEWAHERQSIVL